MQKRAAQSAPFCIVFGVFIFYLLQDDSLSLFYYTWFYIETMYIAHLLMTGRVFA